MSGSSPFLPPSLFSTPIGSTSNLARELSEMDLAQGSPPPSYREAVEESNEDFEPIVGRDRDLSPLIPELRLRQPPLPADARPPRMPRLTSFREADDYEETIYSSSPWTSLESEVITDLLRPIRSFAGVRERLGAELNNFEDDDVIDEGLQSVDSYGYPLTPIALQPGEGPRRGRARPGARPPQRVTPPELPSDVQRGRGRGGRSRGRRVRLENRAGVQGCPFQPRVLEFC